MLHEEGTLKQVLLSFGIAETTAVFDQINQLLAFDIVQNEPT
jgi:hypothetical protein